MSRTGVGSRIGRAWSSNDTTETVSSPASRSASRASDDCTSPSRLRMSMLPDRSTTRVTLTRGRSVGSTSRAATATRTSWVPSRAGAGRTREHAQVVVGGRGVVVLHGVDPFLDPDRLGWRAEALLEQAVRDAVRPGVDVERERRQRVLPRVDEAAGARVDERVVVGGSGDLRRRGAPLVGEPGTGLGIAISYSTASRSRRSRSGRRCRGCRPGPARRRGRSTR